jgi:tetratricopeptide (TPR) repeat protein
MKTVRTVLILLSLFLSPMMYAQTLSEGTKYLYYEHKPQAVETLQKALDKNPNDIQTVYWLGQAYLANPIDIAAAENLYNSYVSKGVNDPYVRIGLLHAQLLKGADAAKAKQSFEAIITETKKKTEDPNILLAIGRANADGGRQFGDAAYGIEKLKRAAELDKTNPEIPYLLGVSYLKLGGENGGPAVEAFRQAVQRDPKYARALYRIGKIYESQENKEAMENYYGQAIAADQAFAPAYLSLFYWYANRDVNAAKEFVEKYIANSPKSCETDYWSADYLFRAGKYSESIQQATNMANSACSTYYQLPILFAYNYERLGDTAKAKTYLETFISTAKPEQIQPDHYLFGASLLKRFPGSELSAINLLVKATEFDTITKNRVKYMDTIAGLYNRIGDSVNRFTWVQKSYVTNPKPSNRDLFDYAEAAAKVNNFKLADSLFKKYSTDYPEQAVGYYYRAKYAMQADSTLATAVEPIRSYISYMQSDTAKYKPSIIYYHSLLAQYYANTIKDYPAAVNEFNAILEIDPENATAKKYAQQLQAIINKKSGAAPKASAKSSSSDSRR